MASRLRGGGRPGPYVPAASSSPAKWVLYGYALRSAGTVRERIGITMENLQAEEEGHAAMTIYALRGWEVHAVLVRLDHGRDLNGERHVVRRVGDGRAWWE